MTTRREKCKAQRVVRNTLMQQTLAALMKCFKAIGFEPNKHLHLFFNATLVRFKRRPKGDRLTLQTTWFEHVYRAGLALPVPGVVVLLARPIQPPVPCEEAWKVDSLKIWKTGYTNSVYHVTEYMVRYAGVLMTSCNPHEALSKAIDVYREAIFGEAGPPF